MHFGNDWIIHTIGLARRRRRLGGFARPQSHLQFFRRIHHRPGVRMLCQPCVHLIEKTPRVAVRLCRQPFFHGFEFQKNWFSLHIRFLPLIAAGGKPSASDTRVVPPMDAPAAKLRRWPDACNSTSEDNPPDAPWRRPNAPHPPWLWPEMRRRKEMLPPVHPPPACGATPSTCSKYPAVAGSLSGRPPPPRATLPPKSRTQNTDGATATNPWSRRATDAPLMRHRARRRPRHQITHHARLDVNRFHRSPPIWAFIATARRRVPAPENLRASTPPARRNPIPSPRRNHRDPVSTTPRPTRRR